MLALLLYEFFDARLREWWNFVGVNACLSFPLQCFEVPSGASGSSCPRLEPAGVLGACMLRES